jgi:hypothetical protein
LTLERSAISPTTLDFPKAVAHHSCPRAADQEEIDWLPDGKRRDRNDICLADWSPTGKAR